MEKLLSSLAGITLYQAGLPGFPRNFTRDGIISAILARNPAMLHDQLSFNAVNQGRKLDPTSGEEPGKIFHEHPGAEIEGYSTEFNASDTTALYLIGHEVYQKLTGSRALAQAQRSQIEAAVEYIKRHLKDGLFTDGPSYWGAKRGALKVTYWKDSQIAGRSEGIPDYPVVYTLAHIQNMRGLRSAALLLERSDLDELALKMVEALDNLWDSELGNFYIAIDRQGAIRGVSSDGLHALFYLKTEDLPQGRIQQIAKSSQVLETPIGYRTIAPATAEGVADGYHARTVWPFEQAAIHIGARKFNFPHVAKVAERIMPRLLADANLDPEVYELKGEEVRATGCQTQLWTIAAKTYFETGKQQLPLV